MSTAQTEYVLVFECCGNEVPLGLTREIGAHGDHCLACDTPAPDTYVEGRPR